MRLGTCAVLMCLAQAATSSLAWAQPRARNVLEDLTRLRPDTRSRRISSFDPTGGNNDRIENIAAGRAQGSRAHQGAGRHQSHLDHDRAAAAHAQPARHHPADVLGRREGAERRGADRRILRAGLERELSVLVAAARGGTARRAGARQLLPDAVREERARRDRERQRARDRRVLLLHRLRRDEGAAAEHGVLPRLVQPEGDGSAAVRRERVVRARAAGQEHRRQAQLSLRRHRRPRPLRWRQLLREFAWADVVRRRR